MRTCATMAVHRRLLNTDPNYRMSRERLETLTLARKRARFRRRTKTTQIPVVCHVVYHTLVENISVAQIASQIDILNQDFNGRNPDTQSVPTAWRDIIGDVQIEFKLADRDPSGAFTNGITRTATQTVAFSDDDAVKSVASGGAAAWPADRYLNIWVCNLQDLLGYAQFPGGPAHTDGVVINYLAFGTNGTAEAPFDLGRTTTHEVGHWLNLFHIWGDDGLGCAGSDMVDDTPNQASYNIGNPVFPHVTCNNGPYGDMFVNFMDYVDDRSMVMFTIGQVERMHAALDTARSFFSGQDVPQPDSCTTTWLHSDLNLATGAPEAAGEPVVALWPASKLCVLFRGVDNHIHVLRVSDDSTTWQS